MVVYLPQEKTEQLLFISDLVFEYDHVEIETCFFFEHLIQYLGWSFEWRSILRGCTRIRAWLLLEQGIFSTHPYINT